MPFMSRFRKEKDEDKEDEEVLEETLAEGEEGGLLMATAARQDRPAEGEEGDLLLATASQPDRPEEDGAGAQEAATALDSPKPDPLEAPTAEEAPPEPDSAEGESASEPESSGASGDDPLSMFRGAAVESVTSDLTNEIEDIPVQELLAELREVRSLLPPTSPDADTGAE